MAILPTAPEPSSSVLQQARQWVTILCLTTCILIGPHPQIMSSHKNLPHDNPKCSYPQNNTTILRSQFYISGCTFRGNPSSGDLINGNGTAAELEWLGLSRSHTADWSQELTAEDEFCYQILRLGARWWKSETFYIRRPDQVSSGYPWPSNFSPTLHLGYHLQLSGESLPEEWAQVQMAFTMDDRCRALVDIGAIFYADVRECEDISKSLEDGAAIGRLSEGRLRQIDKWWWPLVYSNSFYMAFLIPFYLYIVTRIPFLDATVTLPDPGSWSTLCGGGGCECPFSMLSSSLPPCTINTSNQRCGWKCFQIWIILTNQCMRAYIKDFTPKSSPHTHGIHS